MSNLELNKSLATYLLGDPEWVQTSGFRTNAHDCPSAIDQRSAHPTLEYTQNKLLSLHIQPTLK